MPPATPPTPPALAGHVHRDPAAPAVADPAWLAWSKAWTKQAKTLTGRDDLTVTVAPGAGRGAPVPSWAAARRVS
jgi:hypothetical protein